MQDRQKSCPDCSGTEPNISRRGFVRQSALGIAAAAGVASAARPIMAAPFSDRKPPETLVKMLYDSLDGKQKEQLCFAADHKLRNRFNANWAITKPEIGDFLNSDQLDLTEHILRGVCSEDGFERFAKQMDDDSGGWEAYHIAIFGEPGSDNFEWVMTGRHLTIRCDGSDKDGTAFGGPIVYGHGEESARKNVFYYQTQKANEVFDMLEGKQRKAALVKKAPPESAVIIQKSRTEYPGLNLADLSSDQKSKVKEVMGTILAPYRKEDVQEALHCLEEGGGIDKINMAFYQEGDLMDDKVWDIWRIEGPTFVWHFRGAPHVHAYINVTTTPNR